MKSPYNTVLYKIQRDAIGVEPEGKGSKGLVVAVALEEASGGEMETLQKMIAAIRYDIKEDVTILRIPSGQQFPLTALEMGWQDLLVFGLSPASVGLQIEHLQEKILFLESRKALFSPSLREINSSIPKKQALWRLLQEMFLNVQKSA